MRLATITNWAYGATVVLTLSSGGAMLFASQAHDAERAAVAQRYALDQATSQVENQVYRLTDQARQFAISGAPGHLIVYRREGETLGSIEERLAHLDDAGASADELNALAEAIRWADTLHDEQRAAITAKQNGDDATARQMLFGAEYERELARVDSLVERFQYRLDERTASEVTAATRLSVLWQRVSETVLAITALLFLCVLYFILRRRILKPVVRLSDVVTRLASQDYAVEPPEYSQVDEIGDMTQAIRVFRENGLERQRLERIRDEDMHIRALLARMTQRLQSCQTIEELGEVASHFVPEITDGSPGRLYTRDKHRNVLTELCQWLSPTQSEAEFPPLQCWALRRGTVHRPRGGNVDVPCAHLDGSADEALDTVCLPLIAQHETIGLLYLERVPAAASPTSETPEIYLEMLAENIGLAIANLELREALSAMAMVDPLTGLPNRRQLGAALERHSDVGQTADTVSCLMLDIDHFKRFNDEFGHEAGDAVLRQVGATLAGSVREGATAFRFGGEEFVVLVPDLSQTQALARAEQIRSRIASLNLRYEGRPLGTISVSIGVASAPDQCPHDRLVQTADEALLKAKAAGRDRVVAASTSRGQAAA